MNDEQQEDQQAEGLEQFIERAAKTELAAIGLEWQSVRRDVKRLRDIAADLVGRCDLILTGKSDRGPF